ncbi:MAG: hypothetical protein AAF960_21220 [Bacteroidota bacterium]
MSPTIFILLAVLAAGLVAFSLLYLLYRLYVNFQPGKNRILNDFRQLRDEVAQWSNQLIPWTEEEMSLLSPRQVNQKIKRGITKTAQGIFTSIYQEPLIVYNYRKYIARGENAILYARTSKNEFAYRIKKKGIDINIDGEYAGVLRENGGLYGGRRNRLIARINRDDELQLHPIVIGEKEVASVLNPTKTTKHNPRAFQFLRPINKKEEPIFMALAILEMVQESLEEEF